MEPRENKETPELFRDKYGVLWRLDDSMTWVEVPDEDKSIDTSKGK